MANKVDNRVRITLRLPPELYSELEAVTDETNNSMNAEIVHRLEQSLEGRTMDIRDMDATDTFALMSILNDKLAKMIGDDKKD